MTYEQLQIQHENLNIVEMDLSAVKGLKGLCFNENIAIEKNMTQTEKSCVLAEELGHHYTTSGDILDQSDTSNRKQELRARLHGYNMQIGLLGIIDCFRHGCCNPYEMAEHLDVTEEYLLEALKCYSDKYGTQSIRIDDYSIRFEPRLSVMKNFE